jgi:pimeloyl-ACP methyl ester carboxylesterase
VMQGAAHLPGFEQPEAFAAVVRAFLEPLGS